MEEFRDMEEFVVGLGVKMAVVQIKPGESTKAAWNRHIKDNPDDALATLKIFKSG